MIHAAVLAAVVAAGAPATPSPWVGLVTSIRYVSPSGDSVTLLPAINELRDESEQVEDPAKVAASATFDPSTGLVDVCFPPAYPGMYSAPPGCSVDVILRAADTSVPSGTPRGAVKDSSIGLTLQQLLNRLHADSELFAKILRKGPHGDVVRVDTSESPPSNCQSGQCDQSSVHITKTYYFLSNGVVVARAYHVHTS